MSTIARHARRPSSPPVDADLQELYNQVLAGFADESPTESAPPPLGINHGRHPPQPDAYSPNSIYSPSAHSDDSAGTPSSSRPSYRNPIASPTDGKRPLPTSPSSMRSQSSATSLVSPRPLPKLPPTSATSSPTHMPEPHPYHHDPPPPPPPLNGHDPQRRQYAFDSLRSPNGAQYRGMPKDPKDVRGPSSLRPGSATTPASPSQTFHRPSHSVNAMPSSDSAPEWSPPPSNSRLNGSGAQFQRTPSLRPPGAGAPRIPGTHEIIDDGPRVSPSVSSSGSLYPARDSPSTPSSGSPYFPNDIKQSQLYRPSVPPPPPLPQGTPARLTVPKADIQSIGSSEDILAVGQPGFAHSLSSESVATRNVARHGSTGSTTSSTNLTRNLTASSLATTSSLATSYGPPNDSSPDSKSHYSLNTPDLAITVSASTPPPRSRLAAELESTQLSMKGREAAQAYQAAHAQDEFEDEEDFELDDLDDYDDDEFANFSLLSNIAVWLRDEVPRGTHVKGSIPYPRAFTGKDIVNTLTSRIRRELLAHQGFATNDRYIALQVARSLQQQLFFYEVEWGGRVLQDGVEDVYMFLDDQEGGHDAAPEREELPTSVITVLTSCYSPSCTDEAPCYAFACPRKVRLETPMPESAGPEVVAQITEEWSETVDPDVLRSLPESEVNRQTIIHRLISKEVQYVRDLDLIESIFIKPLRYANPAIVPSNALESFIDDVFGNLTEVRESNRRLLDLMNVRQREQSLVIKRIGDVLLEAATEFRLVYPTYIGHLPMAEKRLKDEAESNYDFRLFLEQCGRNPDARRIELKVFLNRPAEHLQKYETTLEAIAKETAVGNPDADYLMEAVQAFKSLQVVCQLQTFQTAMCKGPMGRMEWHDMLSEEARKAIPKEEQKRQSIIFELIKGEMQYVRDLENIDIMYVQPLRQADIIPRDRLPQFIHDAFHNFGELHAHHQKLLERLHIIQRDEHPIIHSVTAAIFDAALNWRESYMEYVTNYPIAEYRIVDEMNTNPAFKDFVEQCTRHPDANRLDMKSFVNRPIPRLARYELLLKGIKESSPEDHEDRDSIPQVIEVIKSLLKETQPGVASAEQKVELWRYNANIVFKPGEFVDMDLLADNRSLIHAGKLLRQPDTGFEWSGWSELFVLLFDNYLVMTKPKDRDGVTKYHVSRHPIPLDLLTLANFTDPPTQRGTGILRGFGGGQRDRSGHADSPGPLPPAAQSPDSAVDARVVYPCTIHHNGRLGGLYTVYAESAQVRAEWLEKLNEALVLRKVVQESNKVFDVETLSVDTFLAPSFATAPANNSWNAESAFTGQVTCSVPFTTADGRALVAVGCAEGVWIGFRHDARSMRRVLHLKMVTQCAMLEEFGIFLVLADKSLFAYHIEALVPSSPHATNTSQTPQKLNGSKDVHFFSVGTLGDRTLVIYMKKKGMDSIFRVLEPVVDKINERAKAPVSFGSRLGFRPARSDWFRVYKDFFLPSESYDLIFLKARIAVLCTKGFEIMDLTDFKSVTIPQRDDPRYEKLAKRCDSCRPMGMFRTSENEFLLCYDEFGLFVNRHGDPIRDKSLIEWEGTAERVAWHPPYILIFDTRFIEIRTVETGRLCQIVPGQDVRAIWDGRGTSHPPPSFPRADETWQDVFSLETRIHGVMRAPDPPPSNGPRRPVIAQHVFELVPTIPLYVPERIGSPTLKETSFGGPHGFGGSPPQSPRMSTASSMHWR